MKYCFRVLVFTALAVLLGACSRRPQGHALPEPPRVAQGQPGTAGGRLALGIPGNPRTFNPLLDADGASDAAIRLLFSPLVGISFDTQEPEPALAESWSVAPDQKTWTFKLRKNLRWSDGQPLTADDVVFTWNDVMYNPKYNQITYDLFRFGGKNFEVTKVDDLTVRVVTPEVFAPFLEYFGSVVILPRHVLGLAVAGNQFLTAYGTNSNPAGIVGSGPFRLKDFEPGNVVHLEPNPEYWAVDKNGTRLPYFDSVELLVADSPIGFQALFLDGKTAAYENVRPQDAWQFQQAAASNHAQFVDLGVGVERDFFWFNQNTGSDANGKPFVDPAKLKWFRDKKFRQAISCAINRDQIISQVYGGRAQAVYGFLSSDNKKWNNPNIPKFAYDPDKAAALLAEIGMTNHASDGTLADAEGHPVEFSSLYSQENPARQKIAELIAGDLKKLGIKFSPEPVNFPTLLRKINLTMDYESASMGLGGGGLDPASQMNVLKSDAQLHQWFPSQQHPSTDWEARLDSLMETQMRTLDFAERKKAFDEAQAIWAEQIPMICLAAPSSAAVIRTDIGNVRPAIASAYHVTWNIEELYFKK
ncbi:MAG TPA: ABC transporter substrate-binding protein [Verrucomicrobiae bacterium]|nr:ABC transporter substrate-binding protein [Verrucomicrobiae bacterium]